MINRIILRIKNYGFLSIPSAILTKIKLFIYRPKVILEKVSIKPITLGSQYGAKRFFDFHELHNSRILSCGLGEDASFDIEFDGFNSPSKKALSDYYEVDLQLRANGYLCYDFDGLADFLYVQSNRVKEELNNI